jgi:hypothetical protein
MNKTVYVLLNEYQLEFDGGSSVRVFNTLSHAQEQMLADVTSWVDRYSYANPAIEDWEKDYGDMSVEYYEEGYYNDNHIAWRIYKTEIEQDPEQKI